MKKKKKKKKKERERLKKKIVRLWGFITVNIWDP